MKANFIFRIISLTVFFLGTIKAVNRCNNKSFKLETLDWSKNILFGLTDSMKIIFFLLTAYSFFGMRNSTSMSP